MILPNNGKVVIIDDKPDDVKDLIAALSKEKVPFVHYKEDDLSDLPDTPIENVRLLFLDLELLTDVYQSPKDITGPIKTRLQRILTPHTAYALVIWSKKDNTYKNALINDFDTEFVKYKPIFHTSLPKADITKSNNPIELIKKELELEMLKFKSLNAFLIWESMVNEASGNLTNQIAKLFPPDDLWDKKTKFLLYKLALAYSGKAVNNFDDLKQLKNALYTLTTTFSDNIENFINTRIDDNYKGLICRDNQEIGNFMSKLNKLLLTSDGNDDSRQPGNVFFIARELESKMHELNKNHSYALGKIKSLSPDDQAKAKEGQETKYNKLRQELEKATKDVISKTNDITVSGCKEETYNTQVLRDEIISNAIYIELNITPLCDYAQEKVKVYRMLPGVLI
jgi:hypothetical protein